MTLADAYLAEVGAYHDAWDSEHAEAVLLATEGLPADVQEAQLLREASRPALMFVIPLGSKDLPGRELVTDAEWAAMAAQTRREVLAYRRAGLDGGLAARHLRLIDRIESLLGDWPEADWAKAVRSRARAG